MSKGKILYVSQEMAPFLELSSISKMARTLPQKMQESGYEIRALMPRFGCINERRNRLHEVIRLSGMNIVVNDTDNPLIIKVASIPSARMQVYFLDNEDYFHRKTVFEDKKGKFHADNDERAMFFCIGVLETVKKLGWSPDIIHCQGWMTGFLPMLLKTVYKDEPMFKHSKMVYSVYEEGFEGSINPEFSKRVLTEGVTADEMKPYGEGTCGEIHKGAIHYADAIIKGVEAISDDVNAAIKSQDKPTLEFKSADEYIEAYGEFYAEIAVNNDELETV